MNFNKHLLLGTVAAGFVMIVPAFASAATLSLSPSSGSHAAGTTFEVKVLLDTTGSTTSGTDAYIRFDPNVLQVVDANSSANGIQVLPGTLYSQTSFNSTDNSEGKVSFSGSKSGGSPGYSGSGTLATITFEAIKEATSTDVSFDFTKGSTTDSNVIDQSSSDDVLNSVTNAKYTIGAGSATGDGSSDGGTGTGTGAGSTGDGSGSTGAGGTGGSDGTGGSGDVAATGIDLNGYMLATIISLVGAGFFLFRRPKRS